LDLWLLIIEKVVTWQELNEYWSMDDVLRAGAALDIQRSIEAAHQPTIPKPRKGK